MVFFFLLIVKNVLEDIARQHCLLTQADVALSAGRSRRSPAGAGDTDGAECHVGLSPATPMHSVPPRPKCAQVT